MIGRIIQGEDIALSNAQIVVNAANGFGFMGGKRCIKELHSGVAESIQYVSKGTVERLSKSLCRHHSLLGFPPGSVFLTEAPNMNTLFIIHAVTMRTPGSKTKFETIEKLVPEIIKYAENLHLETAAIPLLGTGTGGLPEMEVFDYLKSHLADSSVEFWIYTK